MLSARAYSFRRKSRLAVWLTWVAGYTNVIAFLMLGSALVSHVTGNVTHVGLAVGEAAAGRPGAGRHFVFFGFLVLAFFLGAVASAVMTELARRRGAASKYVLPMAVEAVLLSLLAVGIALHEAHHLNAGHPLHHYWMAGVAAAAMGLQNATITRISGAVVRTTHLTGVVTDLGLEGVQYALAVYDGRRRGDPTAAPAAAATPALAASRRARALNVFRRAVAVWRAARRQPAFQRLLVLAGIFGSFWFGAAAGTLAFYAAPSAALAVPVAFLLWIVWNDHRRPIADVRELDLTAEPSLRGAGAVRAMLPPGVGLYRLAHRHRRAVHGPPDFQVWVDRLPARWRVVVLVVSPLTRFDADSVLDLAAAVRRLRSQQRELVLCGVRRVQYKALSRGGLVDVLGRPNLTGDVELAVARAINLAAELGCAGGGAVGSSSGASGGRT